MPATLTDTIHNHIQNGLTASYFGFVMPSWLMLLVVVGSIALFSFLCFLCFKLLVLRFSSKAFHNSNYVLMRAALQHGVFYRMAFLIPGFIFYLFIPLVSITKLSFSTQIIKVTQTAAIAYMIIVSVMVLAAFLNCLETCYQRFKIAKNYSIKSYIQIIKIILALLAVILIVSLLMNKSPMYFLTSIGAMTAVLLLVFRDSMLGFVASVQLAAYDMLRVGDWVEMPGYGADGMVIDISLNTIKVQNFDKTIVTIPSHALLSSSVKNWRGMSDSGSRRIKRSLLIDVNSIKFCDSALLSRLSTIPALQHKIESLSLTWNEENNQIIAEQLHVEKACLTNLSAFRIFMEDFLSRHPKIHKERTFLVRELEAAGAGLPVELYIFASDNNWEPYERAQAEIFDYMYALLPFFELKPFQYLTGAGFVSK